MMKQMEAIIIVFMFSCLHEKVSFGSKSGEYLLKREWPRNYDRDTRPIINATEPIHVTFGVAIAQIVEVDTKGETFSVNLFIRQKWKDQFLTWDPEKYGGLKSTNLSPDKIWLPDVVLENNADDENEMRGNLDQLPKKAIVSSDGDVSWFSVTVLTGKCSMEVQYFPFDLQLCNLVFTSWTFDGSKLNISTESNEADLSSYSPHTEWELVSAEQIHTEEKYPCCEEKFSVVTVAVSIRRRPLFHTIHLVIPMIVVTLLTLYAFNIPSKSGERISFGVTLLLAMTLFMTLLAGMIPANADSLSKLGIFFNFLILEMVIMIVMMCYVARMYHKHVGDKTIPKWMKKYIFEYLSYKLFIRCNKQIHEKYGHYPKKMLDLDDSCNALKQPNFKTSIIKKYSTNTHIPNGVLYDNIDEEKKVKVNQPNHISGYQQKNENEFDCKEDTKESEKSNEKDVLEEDSGKDNVPPVKKGNLKFKALGQNVIKINSESALSNQPHEGTKPKLTFKGISSTVTHLMKKKNEIMLAKMNQERAEKRFLYEWRICAMTIDRLCFIFFLLLFALTSGTVFYDF